MGCGRGGSWWHSRQKHGELQRLKVSWLDIVFNAPQSDNIRSDDQFKEDSPVTNVVLLLSSGQLYLVPFIWNISDYFKNESAGSSGITQWSVGPLRTKITPTLWAAYQTQVNFIRKAPNRKKHNASSGFTIGTRPAASVCALLIDEKPPKNRFKQEMMEATEEGSISWEGERCGGRCVSVKPSVLPDQTFGSTVDAETRVTAHIYESHSSCLLTYPSLSGLPFFSLPSLPHLSFSSLSHPISSHLLRPSSSNHLCQVKPGHEAFEDLKVI